MISVIVKSLLKQCQLALPSFCNCWSSYVALHCKCRT